MKHSARALPSKYTLVLHSGAGYAGKGQFGRAVEERCIITEAQLRKVQEVGGLVLDSYTAASDRAMEENYPPDVKGLVPRVRGRFSRFKIDGLNLYIPPRIVCGKCGLTAEPAALARHRSDAPLCAPCERGEREADEQEQATA